MGGSDVCQSRSWALAGSGCRDGLDVRWQQAARRGPLGKSLRIFKSELHELHTDARWPRNRSPRAPGPGGALTAPAGQASTQTNTDAWRSRPTQFPEVGQARGEHPTVPHVACAAAPLRSPDRLSSRRVTRAAIYKGWWQCLRGPETPSEGGRRGGARRETICRGNASYANRDDVGSGSCRHWLTGRKSDERARVATVCR